MATVQELKEVVKETLDNRGVLGQLKARIRAEVFHALDDHSEPKPRVSNENLMINELIREYLEFNKYKYSASVLMAESGQPETKLDREFLVNELNILEDNETTSVPLLYSIIASYMNKGKVRSSRQQSPRRNNPSSSRVPVRSPRHVGRREPDDDDMFESGSEIGHGPFVVQGGRR